MKNILLVLISFVIIGCRTVSPVTNTVDLTSLDFSNARNLREAKMCETYTHHPLNPSSEFPTLAIYPNSGIHTTSEEKSQLT